MKGFLQNHLLSKRLTWHDKLYLLKTWTMNVQCKVFPVSWRVVVSRPDHLSSKNYHLLNKVYPERPEQWMQSLPSPVPLMNGFFKTIFWVKLVFKSLSPRRPEQWNMYMPHIMSLASKKQQGTLYLYITEKLSHQYPKYISQPICDMSMWVKQFHIYTQARDYSLLGIMTWNLCSKYSPWISMLIFHVIMIFYISFFGDYYLKMSRK